MGYQENYYNDQPPSYDYVMNRNTVESNYCIFTAQIIFFKFIIQISTMDPKSSHLKYRGQWLLRQILDEIRSRIIVICATKWLVFLILKSSLKNFNLRYKQRLENMLVSERGWLFGVFVFLDVG